MAGTDLLSCFKHAGYVSWLRRIQRIMSGLSETREHRIALLCAFLGRQVTSTKELTIAEIQAITAVWDACPDEMIHFAYSFQETES